MWYTFVNISKQQQERISGNVIQHFYGTLSNAVQFAKETRAVNSNRIQIGIIECWSHVACGSYLSDRKALSIIS